jgi:Co/Zn/Cd efflux system component
MDSHVPHASTDGAALRWTVRLVALLNLGYFGVEFTVALAIGSVSLFLANLFVAWQAQGPRRQGASPPFIGS